MKYILLFLCILNLSCKYNVSNPVMTLKDYTVGSGKVYYVSSSATIEEIEESLRNNYHSLEKYKIVVTNGSDISTRILTNIAAVIKKGSFNNVEVDITKTKITEIPANIFKNMGNLESIALPDTVKKIEKDAFSGCSLLSNIRFSGGLTDILGGAFSGCSSLPLVMLSSKSLTNISTSAFSGCSSLVNLILPANISNIDGSAFNNCSKLANVEYLGTNKNVKGSPFASGSNPNNLYLPSMDGTTNKISSSFLGKSWATINYGKHIPN